MTESSAAKVVTLTLNLTPSAIFNSGMQNVAEVLLLVALDASV